MTEPSLFAVGLRRQAHCRLGVPCVMRDCERHSNPEGDVHFFAPDGNIYPPEKQP